MVDHADPPTEAPTGKSKYQAMNWFENDRAGAPHDSLTIEFEGGFSRALECQRAGDEGAPVFIHQQRPFEMTPSITDCIRNIWKHRMPPPVLYPFLILLVLVPGWAKAETQTFTLQPGWNLISFPVLPQDRSPAMVFGAMKSVRGGQPLYQPNGSSSLRIALPAGINPEGRFPNSGDCPQPPLPNDKCIADPLKQTPPLPNSCPSAPLQTFEFGKAYWVFLEGEGINQNAQFTLEGEPAPPTALPLTPGWVGLGLTGVNQPINVEAFFGRERFGGISKPDVLPILGDVVRWDPKNHCFEYYYPDDPDGSAITQIEQGRGYLVKVLKTPTPPFKPQLRLIQGTTVLSTTTSQRLTIPPTDNELTLDVLTPEGGALTWAATLLPIQASVSKTAQGLREEDLPFVFTLATETISAVKSGDQPKSTSVEKATTAKGIAFAELGNQLKIKVNRTHLPPGRYLAKLDIMANTGEHRLYDLEVSSTGLDGEWQGRATIDTVNNKSNPVPDIDLVLQLFRVEVGGQMQLRGLVDSQETLTSWPMDAQIIGYPVAPPTGSSVDADFKNGFWIKAEYVLPPGDVNNYPYEYLQQDVKDATDSVTDLRYRTSAEGDRYYLDLADRSEKQPNFLNPTTRFLRRQVFLTGHFTGVDGAGRSTAQGLYKETLTGLLPEAIELQGTFTLTRGSQLPFARRPFIFFTSDISGFIKVEPKLLVHRALVLIDSTRAQDLKGLTLVGPDERERHSLECLERTGQEEKVVARLLDPPRIQGTPWQPLELQRRPDKNVVKVLKDYRLCRFKETMQPDTLLSAWNGVDAKGTWTLAYEESASTKTDPVISWALLLYGVPMHSLEGHVVVQGSTGQDRFRDVQLQINNLGDRDQWTQKILQFNPDTGAFTLDALPGLHLQLIAKKSGYRDAEIDGLETEKDPRGYHNGIRAILPGDPTLKNPPPSHYTLTLQPLAQ